jgi:serine/threonine protein kinase
MGEPADVQAPRQNKARSFSEDELKRATDNWSPSTILGDGGFAVVFHGKLPSIGSVAIKRVRSPDDKQERKFLRESMIAERETVVNYKHQNICELIGSFVDEQKPNAPYCLVYELCENGNLLERLACCDHKRQRVPALSAEQRLAIALGTCRALEYLHCKAVPPIVHRDIKSANILLDTNFCAKVADFGTIRQDRLQDDDTHIKTKTVIGTQCYMPEEYQVGGEISVKLDSYAFGIVLFEILTGLNPMAKPLRSFVDCALEDEALQTVLDEKAKWDLDVAAQLANIALRCSIARKDKRATAQAVLPELERLRNPNYMPTLAVGRTYYDPDTGILTQGGDSDSDGEGRAGADEGGSTEGAGAGDEGADLEAPLLQLGVLHKQRFASGDSNGMVRQSRPRWILYVGMAVLLVIVGCIAALRAGGHHKRQPTPTPPGPLAPTPTPFAPTPAPTLPACNGSSAKLSTGDCSSWQHFSRDPMYRKWAEGKCGVQVHTDPCSCTFYGDEKVSCSNGRITSLSLAIQGLPPSRGIPEALLDLTGLTYFSVYSNQLVGSIPDAIGKLTGLTSLSLSANQLTGTIPSTMAGLAGLTALDLSENQLVGPMPSTIAKFAGLIHLNLGKNLFTGSVPPEMAQLKLTWITIENNPHLTGQLPHFDFTQFTSCCSMGGDPFVCPLPPGAKKCVGGSDPKCNRNGVYPPTCVISTWSELMRSIDAAAGKGVTIALSPSFTMDGYNGSHVSIDTAYTNVTVIGNGATFDAQNHGRFFEVGKKAMLAMSNVMLRNGFAFNNSGQGGAVYVAAGGTFTVTSTTFSPHNYAGSHKGQGGAVYVAAGGAFTATSTTFLGNYAYGFGGAVYVAAGGTFMATNTTFSGNTAYAAGGALYFGGGGTGFIKGCSFVGTVFAKHNDIYNDGGNVTFACADGKFGAPVQMQGNEIAVIPPKALQCRPPKDWGELKSVIDAAAGREVTITLSASFSGYTAAITIDTAYTNVTIFGNGATFDANKKGRFFEVGKKAMLAMSNVMLRNGYRGGNYQGQGGAVFVAAGGTFTTTSTTFSGNTAWNYDGQGGAVYVAAGGIFTGTSTTFSGNNVDAAGGALYFGGGTGFIKGCSFVGSISARHNDIYNDGGIVTFACADGKVGAPVQMQGNEIAVIPPKALQCRPPKDWAS